MPPIGFGQTYNGLRRKKTDDPSKITFDASKISDSPAPRVTAGTLPLARPLTNNDTVRVSTPPPTTLPSASPLRNLNLSSGAVTGPAPSLLASLRAAQGTEAAKVTAATDVLKPGEMRATLSGGGVLRRQGALPAPGQPDNTVPHIGPSRESVLRAQGYNLPAMARGSVTGDVSLAAQRARVGVLRPGATLQEQARASTDAAAAAQASQDRAAGLAAEQAKANTAASATVAAAAAKGPQAGRYQTNVDKATGDVTITDTATGNSRVMKASDEDKHADDPVLVGLRAERDGILAKIDKGVMGGGIFSKSNPQKLAKVADKINQRIAQLEAAPAAGAGGGITPEQAQAELERRRKQREAGAA